MPHEPGHENVENIQPDAHWRNEVDWENMSPADSTFYQYLDDLEIHPNSPSGDSLRETFLKAGSPYIRTRDLNTWNPKDKGFMEKLTTGERGHRAFMTSGWDFSSMGLSQFSTPDTITIQSPKPIKKSARIGRTMEFEDKWEDNKKESLHEYLAELSHVKLEKERTPGIGLLMDIKSGYESAADAIFKVTGLGSGEGRYKNWGLPFYKSEEYKTHYEVQPILKGELYDVMDDDSGIDVTKYFGEKFQKRFQQKHRKKMIGG